MPSLSRFRANAAPAATPLPFKAYAQLVRTLVPSALRICFYDARARSRWSNDGLEDPELQRHVDTVLSQARDGGVNTLASEAEPLTQVIPILDADQHVAGALALVLSEPSDGTPNRRAGTLERTLEPLLTVLAHAWREPGSVVAAPSREIAVPTQRAAIIGPASRTSSAPALLRHAVSAAANNCDCAFAALLATSRPIALTHRVRAPESQVDLLSLVESLRGAMTQLVSDRATATGTSSVEPPPIAGLQYKFAAYPLRSSDGRLAGVLSVFRQRREADFGAAEFAALEQAAMQLPADVIDQLVPPEPSGIARQTTLETDVASLAAASTEETAPVAAPAIEVRAQDAPLIERMRHALRVDGFELHVQRIQSLHEGNERARYEVLLRMSGDDANVPADFWETARAHALTHDIDRWVVARLLKLLRPHLPLLTERQLEFAINLSAESLSKESFGEFIGSQLARSGVPAHALLFEIAERDAIEQPAAAEALVTKLHALGCRVALDRCREGLDVFKTIRRWPVGCLKIDPALTAGVLQDACAEHIVREVAEVAFDIGVETVGEQVEDAAVVAKLKELRIDFAQGFHFAHPAPLETIWR